MSISSIAPTSPVNVSPQVTASDTNKPKADDKVTTPVKTQPVARDTVSISDAARQAAQEATETPTQTASEARNGDRQAKKMLAKMAVSEELKETSYTKAQENKGINI